METEKRTQSRRRKRTDEDYSKKETEQQTPMKKRKRADEDYSKKETEQRTQSRRRKRADEDYSKKETEQKHKVGGENVLMKAVAKRKRNKKHQVEKEEGYIMITSNMKIVCYGKGGTFQTNISQLIKAFHTKVSNGPTYVCSFCDQLWYKQCHTSSNY